MKILMEDLGKEHPAVKAAHAMADAHSQHETAVPAIRQVAGLLPALDDEQLTDEQLMLIWIGVNAKYLANAESNTKRERATELEYLTWWRLEADFGPSSGDVSAAMDLAFMAETGKNLPEGWNTAQDGDTSIDLP